MMTAAKQEVLRNKGATEKVNQQEIFDEDGITMRQRKNQLGRRLRSLRFQQAEKLSVKPNNMISEGQLQQQQQDLEMGHMIHTTSPLVAEHVTQTHLLIKEEINQMPTSGRSVRLFSSAACSHNPPHGTKLMKMQMNSTTQILPQQTPMLPHHNSYPTVLSPIKSLTRPQFTSLLHPESFSRVRESQHVPPSRSCIFKGSTIITTKSIIS